MAKKVTGVVTSSVQDKTIVVTVTSRQTHPVYGKQYTVNRKYTAHDEKNESGEKQDAAYEIEQWIGRIVVSPVHIAHKGVLDQRKTERFGERESEVPVIDRG